MANLFDYLEWRGDITFGMSPVNAVDCLLFSWVSYVDYKDIVPRELEKSVTQENDGPVYDLLGRKVQNENKQLRKGVYIKKNKKVVVK